MTKFMTLDTSGFPTAFYGEDVHGDRTRPVYGPVPEPTLETPYPVAPIIGSEPNPACTIPADAIEISDEQWMEFLENQGRRKWAGGAIVVYDPPPAPPAVPQSISDRQFFQQLAVVGIVTEDQALASNAAVIPAPLLAIIEAMPAEQQFAAKMLVSGATVFERTHPMTEAIGAAYGWTSAQIDDFFRAASVL